MGLLETVERARTFLERNGRVSLALLEREFELDRRSLAELVAELVEVQRVAVREGAALAWTGPPTDAGTARPKPPGTGVPAESRQLTLMFADLVGSTDLSQRLDAEDLREVVRAYQQAAARAVETYEGHIAQYLGDGILVYFGYPQAHEDDAERAVRAALGVREALRELNPQLEATYGVTLSTRISIHTGRAVLGEMGGSGRLETLALGETANVAARLLAVAPPGGVVTSAATLQLVQGIFVTHDLGPQRLKGVDTPVGVHEILEVGGARERLERAGRLTPFVGRKQEVGILLDAWEQAAAGEGSAVLVCGEAGLGKSRLARAFRERILGEPHAWLECRCSPYACASALQPVTGLVRRALDLEMSEPAAERQRRLTGALAAADLDVEQALPHLADLVGISLPQTGETAQLAPESRRERMLDVLVEWVLSLTRTQPVLLLVEDLHWSDPSTLDLLARLLRVLPESQLLLLMTARPEFEAPWPGGEGLARVALHNLREHQAQELIEALDAREILPAETRTRIVERADGIPLYLEELTRTALEARPGDPRAIPTTLQDSLMARLDRLGPARDLAQLASVLGREFSYELLAAVAEWDESALHRSLERLVTADLLLARGRLPHARYSFRHGLIQETAYDSLLRARRRQLHERTARALERRLPALTAAEPEIVAHHFDEAGLPAEAVTYYLRAGQRETARSATREALAHLRRGLELVEQLPEARRGSAELALRVAIGPALVAVPGPGDSATGENYRRARALCPDEAPELLHILAGLHTHYLNRGEMQASFEVAQEQLERARRTGEAAQLLRAHWAMGQVLFLRGEPQAAARRLEQALGLYDPSRDRALSHDRSDQGVSLRSWLAWSEWLAGRPERARVWADESLKLARRVGHPYSLAYSLGFSAVLLYMMRDREAARRRGRETLDVASEFGFPIYQAVGQLTAVWGAAPDSLELHGGKESIQRFRAALGSLTGRGSQFGRPLACSALAEILAGAGRPGEALETLRTGLAFAGETGIRFWDAELLRLEAEILLGLRSAVLEEVEGILKRALAVARRQEARSLELRSAAHLARLWRKQGRSAEARALLEPVYAGFREGSDTRDLQDAKALLEAPS